MGIPTSMDKPVNTAIEITGFRLLFLAITAALSGFLFGYDTTVINGAEQRIQEIWNLSSVMHGFVVSAALWGTVLGSVIGGKVTDFLGRKPTLFLIGVLYFLSAVWSAFPAGPYTMMVARFIGGVGVGISSIAAPVYIAEISPAASRGKLTALFQFNIVFGVCVALGSNYLLSGIGENAWRFMLGSEAIPALIFVLLCPFLVESPRWLALKLAPVEKSVSLEPKERFFSRKLLYPISLAFFVAFFNQLSGVNAIWYFAKRIFEMAGLGSSALLVTAGLGIVNFAATAAGVWLIDRMGRKTLLLIGGIGYVISLASCSLCFFFDRGAWAAAFIFLFMISHAVGQGTVIWVLIAEVFPQKFRAQGQALGSFTHWFFAALLTFTFPTMAAKLPPYVIFGIFFVMMVFHLIWVITMVPETKGKQLEEIQL